MKFLFMMLCAICAATTHAKEVHYSLNVDYKTVNFSGKNARAMAINNTIPGPVLTFNEGDEAIISVTNLTNDEASIHWHGLLLPQPQDGVPYLTYFPIKAGSSFEYRFTLKHAGTYWYHSHTKIDEQRGQYGAIVVLPANNTAPKYDHDVVVQLSDWTDEDPYQVLKNLKKDGDWYAHKKQSVASIQGYLKHSSLAAWMSNRWQRMEGMDVSDVGYDAFLANGKTLLNLLPNAKAADVVRVRLINSGASSYFNIEQNNGRFTVIAADGLDVIPVDVESLQMGMAETYDLLITIPEQGAFEFAANNIDGTGGVKVTLGLGNATPSPNPKRPNIFEKMMDHDAHQGHNMSPSIAKSSNHNAHQHHQMHQPTTPQIAKKLDYTMLKTPHPVKYVGKRQDVTLTLTGDMRSYNWSFNNVALSKADKIKVDRGNVVRFHFNNESMMHHPLHLHGHFFKVISGNGDYDVLKHTVDVGPMASVTIEFSANEEKDWFFHCHNLYHAKTGMARVVRYSDYQGNPALDMAKMQSNMIRDDDWYYRADVDLFTNHINAKYRLSNSTYALLLASEFYKDDINNHEIHLEFKQSTWFSYFVGSEYSDHSDFMVGVKYVTSFDIETTWWVNDHGEFHMEAETDFQLTPTIGLDLSVSTDNQWSTTLSYRSSPHWSIGINANETSGVGLGLSVTF